MSNNSEKKLRREVEILKAQLAGRGSTEKSSELEKKEKVESSEERSQPVVVEESPTGTYVQKDLKRSMLITAGILALITTLYLTQSYWTTFFL